MKIIVAFLILLISFLNASPNVYGTIQEPAKQKNAVAGDTTRIAGNSVSDYSINVNGQLNSVQITQTTTAGKSAGTVAKQKNTSNTIEINGEGNSVKIDQSKNGGRVNIQQNGNGNRVNISQSDQNTKK